VLILKFAGFQRTTLLDYPNKISAIVFVAGCNFRCGFCHNPLLVNKISLLSEQDYVDENIVVELLLKRKHLVNSVVISGGEPTLFLDIKNFIIKLKQNGFNIKIDTNGSNPELIKDLIDSKLIDFIAMDIKTKIDLDAYSKVCGTIVDIEKIKQSIEIIQNSGLDYDFRMTILPALISKEDIYSVAEYLKGSKRFSIQQFVKDGDLVDEKLKESRLYEPNEFKEIKNKIGSYFDEFNMRGI
jgi:pyruvate formate lyase activating enzyme